MALFNQPQNPTNPANPALPVDQVKQMKAQGMDNNKIITTLQNDGFSSSQIFDAMSQANPQPAESSVQTFGFGEKGGAAVPGSATPAAGQGGVQVVPSEQPQDHVDFQQTMDGSTQPSEINPSNEELIEAIIDEKWNELVDDINKIIDWKNRADSRLAAIEQNIKNLRNEFNNLHQGVLGRISDYDKNLLNVGADLKAMETMFSKVLPTFMENVQKLEDAVGQVKKRK